jgi:hypothetical protein
LLPSLPCCWTLVNRKRYLGNAEVTQDKLPWARARKKSCITWHSCNVTEASLHGTPKGDGSEGSPFLRSLVIFRSMLMWVFRRILTFEHFCLKMDVQRILGCLFCCMLLWEQFICIKYDALQYITFYVGWGKDDQRRRHIIKIVP